MTLNLLTYISQKQRGRAETTTMMSFSEYFPLFLMGFGEPTLLLTNVYRIGLTRRVLMTEEKECAFLKKRYSSV